MRRAWVVTLAAFSLLVLVGYGVTEPLILSICGIGDTRKYSDGAVLPGTIGEYCGLRVRHPGYRTRLFVHHGEVDGPFTGSARLNWRDRLTTQGSLYGFGVGLLPSHSDMTGGVPAFASSGLADCDGVIGQNPGAPCTYPLWEDEFAPSGRGEGNIFFGPYLHVVPPDIWNGASGDTIVGGSEGYVAIWEFAVGSGIFAVLACPWPCHNTGVKDYLENTYFPSRLPRKVAMVIIGHGINDNRGPYSSITPVAVPLGLDRENMLRDPDTDPPDFNSDGFLADLPQVLGFYGGHGPQLPYFLEDVNPTTGCKRFSFFEDPAWGEPDLGDFSMCTFNISEDKMFCWSRDLQNNDPNEAIQSIPGCVWVDPETDVQGACNNWRWEITNLGLRDRLFDDAICPTGQELIWDTGNWDEREWR